MKQIYSILLFLILGAGSLTAQQTWYSLASGDWDNPAIWTLDPAGAIAVGSAVPSAGDNVVIKTGKVVTVQVTDPATVLNLETVTIEGSLKLGSTSGHSIATLKGSGKIFIQGNNFPTVADASHFVTEGKGEGTVVFEGNSFTYGTGLTDTFYNLEVNTNASQTVTLLNNLNLNGNLLILQGTLQINDGTNTSALTLKVTKDITVQANGGMTVGTANAIHRINASGDFKNYGSIDFSNSAQYTAATTGAINVNFTGNSDNDLVCNGTTTFYRLFLNKGTDRTYTLAVNANNVANFSLYGPISGSSGIEGSDGPAGWERLALVINTGTLKLESNINIPQLGAYRDGTGPNEFHIPSTAQLWINGATVATHTSGGSWRGITVYGKLKVSSGSFTNPSGTGGITYFSNPDSPGTLEISGGDVYTTQLKQDNASGKFNYIQSGGTFHINSLSDGRGVSAIFALPGADDYFEMSGGQITIDAINTTATNGIDIGSSLGNYNVTGGTIEIQTPTLDAASETQFEISSTAPFYNLSITQSAHPNTQTVVLQNDLTVLNDLSIAANTTLNVAGFDLEIGGNFTNNGTYTTGTNTTRFIGSNASVVNGGTIAFSAVDIDKEDETNTVSFGTGTISISDSLTISKGTLYLNTSDVNVAGNINVSYGDITGANALVLNGSTDRQTLKGKVGQIPSFGNLKLNNTYGTAPQVKLLSDVDATTVEFQRDLIFDLEGYNLTISNSTYSGADANWDAARLFRTSGVASDGGLTLSVDQNDNGTNIQFFPIGVNDGGTTRYTPMQVDANTALSANGNITVNPVNDYHPTVSDQTYALNYYWKVSQTGLDTDENNIRYVFTHYTTINVPNYRPFLVTYRPEGIVFNQNEWTEYGTGVKVGTDVLRFPYNCHLSQDYSFGILSAFFWFSAPRTLYSITNGNFHQASTWSETRGGTATSDAPTNIDFCIIESTDIVTITNATTRASQVQIDGTLVVNDNAADHEINAIKGSGTLRYNGNNLITGDHSEFCNDPNAIFEYSGGRYNLPTTITIYPNLNITGTDRKEINNKDLYIQGHFFVDQTYRMANDIEGDIEIAGDLIIGASGLLDFRRSSPSRLLTVNGNITFSGAGQIRAQDANDGTTSVEHEIIVYGNIVQGDGLFRLYKESGNGNTNRVNLHFTGENSATVSRSGSGTTEFAGIEIDKPLGEKVQFTGDFDLLGATDGATKALELISGECHLQNAGININLSTGGNDFRIPSGTTLNVDGATVNVGGTGATGIWLDGSLIVNNNGAVYCHKGSGAGNTDNYIEYTSSGDASIWLGSGAKLKVGSQIRRSLNTDVGILSFTQNAATDTVAVGLNEAGNTSRGLFEVLGTGSSFTQAANVEITIARGHGAGYRSLWFDPETVTLNSGCGFVIGDDTHTPASQEIGIYATKAINNLSIHATNTPKATLMVMPLNLQESLSIGTGAELDAAGLDVTLKGNFINAGTYTANSNTTYFDGINDQTITGTTIFYNLVKQTTTNTLNLASTIDVANNLSLLSGTLNTDVNNLNVQGNLINNATTSSSAPSLGIVMNSTTDQQELSGTGVFGRLCIDNSRGVVMPTQSTAISITDLLTLEDGVFDIGRNLMELSTTASFSYGLTYGDYTSANMVQTNLSFSDAGIRKDFPTTAGGSFTYPLGSFGKYTPVSFTNLNYAGGTGSIRVKAANEAHLSVLDITNVLQYNWTLDAQGINGFTADVVMECDPTDIALNGHVVTEYVTAQYLLQPNDTVYKFSVDDFVEPNNLTYQFALATDADIDGDYSAGIPDAIPDKVPSFITVGGGDWQTQNNWATYNPATSATGPAGVGVPVLGPRGSNVYIAHEITLSGNGDAAAYGTILQSTGSLKTGSTIAHRLGDVSGSGTLVLESGDMPAGVYDEFFSATGGTLEFTGTAKNYDMLSEITQLNNLTISGTGTRNFPNLDVQLLGDLTFSGPDVDNLYDKVLSVKGDITFSGGSYNPRTGSLILNGSSLQTLDGTVDFTSAGGGELYDLTINNAANANVVNDIEVSNTLTLTDGVLSTKAGGNLTITNSLPAAIVGGSDASYVEGPLGKALGNNSTFEFPVGDAMRYSPITVSPDNSSGGTWLAQYYNHSPGVDGFAPTSRVLHPDVDSVSYVSQNEYWRVEAPSSGSKTANLTMRWDANSGVIPDANFRITRWTDLATDAWSVNGLTVGTTTGDATGGTVDLGSDLVFGFSGADNSHYLTFGSVTIPEYDWLGGSSNWFTTTNWGSGTVPGAGTDVTIPSGVTAPVISNSALAQVNNLTINSGTSLILQPGAKMTINGILTTNSTNLIIQNSEALPTSLMVLGAVAGGSTVQVDWTYGDANRYYYIGHGYSGATWNTYDGQIANTFSIYSYPGSWNLLASGAILGGAGNELEGYAFKIDNIADATISHTGSLNTGNYSTTINGLSLIHI
jgi:archaellum component FlaF (FlaF/FlaG flagellin family)